MEDQAGQVPTGPKGRRRTKPTSSYMKTQKRIITEDKYYKIRKIMDFEYEIKNLWNENIYNVQLTPSKLHCTCPHSMELEASSKNEVKSLNNLEQTQIKKVFF